MVTLHTDAYATLADWQPSTPDQRSLRQAFLSFMTARPDACRRSCEPGHITASALVLDSTGKEVLLTLHPRVGAWLQLGGHCEETDSTLMGAALREASEESGIEGLVIEPTPVHLGVHPITCSLGKPTTHFDVRFVVRAPAGATPVCSDESLDLRWWPIGALPEDTTDTDLPEMLAAVG